MANPRFDDVAWFTERLQIVNRQGRVSYLSQQTEEQKAFLKAFETGKNICVIKPRQIGMTTITTACLFWLAYMARDPIGVLSLTHESGACARINMMLRQFVEGLPSALRPALLVDNSREIVMSHNKAAFRQLMAGGRGQGRSFTYQVLHATEMGFWPQGSSAVSGTSVDEDVWASVLAAMHDGPYRRVVVESTGNGPSGVFYKIAKTARMSDQWQMLFFPWSQFTEYRRTPGPDFKLTDEEQELKRLHHLSIEQLAWRRSKLLDDGYSIRRFRKEYPLTWEEPFLLDDASWFDAEHLNRVLAKIPANHGRREGAYIEYELPEQDQRYFVGMDTSGGTGGDYSVIVVIKNNLEVVAVWATNLVAPHEQARVLTQISARFNGAEALVEENNYGREVIERAEALGCRTWKDHKGKNFWSQGGRAGHTKLMVYVHARELVNAGHSASALPDDAPLLNDAEVINQLIVVREGKRGNIEAPSGSHDDHADAYVLALWCARGHYTVAQTKPKPTEQARLNRWRQIGSFQ